MRHPLTRRTALKASGIAITLPWLESMACGSVSDSGASPQRMVLICSTLGLYSPALFPSHPGRNYRTTEYLKILENHRKDFTLIGGLSHPDQSGKDPHDSEITWLTSARNPGLGGFKNTISVDQFAASQVGNQTRFRSLSLSTFTQKSQSYTTNGVMIPANEKPSAVFEKLFLKGSPREIKKNRQYLAQGRSLLDFVGEQTKALKRKSSTRDHRQLDEFFQAVRKAESDLAESEAWMDRPKPDVNLEKPKDIVDPSDLIGRTQALFNLIPLILETDSTRIVSVVIQGQSTVPKIQGVNAGHHPLSHHGRDPDKIKQLKIIEGRILNCFGSLLNGLGNTTEKGRRLLDSTSVLFGSNLGNANAHDPRNLPILVAGGGFEHGKYVSFDRLNNRPLCNLFVSLLNQFGLETEQFGTSTGPLDF